MLTELTDREHEVLKLIADGLTNREISCNLGISESTVENHIHHIYGKLRITNRAQAVAYAFRAGIFCASEIAENRGNPS